MYIEIFYTISWHIFSCPFTWHDPFFLSVIFFLAPNEQRLLIQAVYLRLFSKRKGFGKRITPCKGAFKTVPENGVRSCVQFSLANLYPREDCDVYSRPFFLLPTQELCCFLTKGKLYEDLKKKQVVIKSWSGKTTSTLGRMQTDKNAQKQN